jgi:cell division protein FtsA
LAKQTRENEIVSIPGLRGREPKEISVKNLAHIIQARVEEIIDNVYYEIKNSGYEKKLIAGIVITGGGSQLKNISQLVEYITGMDTRIGYPNEHLGKGFDEVKSPMYATGVGLVISGLKNAEYLAKKNKHALGEVKPGPTGGDDVGTKAPGFFSGRWLEFIKKSLVDDGGDSNLNG